MDKQEKEPKRIKERLFKDKPLSEISLKEFERPTNDYMTNLRRFCISLGVISPGESRVAIVHILDVLIKARSKKQKSLDSYEIVKELYRRNIKIVYANVLRDVRKLISIGLVEKRENRYRIRENLPLHEILKTYIKPYIVDKIFNRITEYAESIDKSK